MAKLASGPIDIKPDVACSTERAGKYDFSDEQKIEEGLLKVRKLESLGVLAAIFFEILSRRKSWPDLMDRWRPCLMMP